MHHMHIAHHMPHRSSERVWEKIEIVQDFEGKLCSKKCRLCCNCVGLHNLVINKIGFYWSLRTVCFSEQNDNAHGQKSEHINFLRQMEDFVYILYLAKETVLTLIAPKPEKQKITERNKSNLYSCCNDHDRLIKCTQELSQMRCNWMLEKSMSRKQ